MQLKHLRHIWSKVIYDFPTLVKFLSRVLPSSLYPTANPSYMLLIIVYILICLFPFLFNACYSHFAMRSHNILRDPFKSSCSSPLNFSTSIQQILLIFLQLKFFLFLQFNSARRLQIQKQFELSTTLRKDPILTSLFFCITFQD